MIAMALITRPALLIADEPTTALDVTTQAQILDLMRELQGEAQMSLLLITHDLGVVANMADHVVVMYRGRVVEAGPREDLFRRAQHPYLKALMRAVPRFAMAPGERLTPIREVKSAILARRTEAAQARPDRKGRARRRGSVQELHAACRLVQRPNPQDPRRQRRQPAAGARQDARARRRVRLRQDHRVEDDHAGAPASIPAR
jgi:ABC-type dipeptide/oligopeptide/nickel transport system ATPase component